MDAASESKLAGVNAELARRVRQMAANLAARGISIKVISGYRSNAEQERLYAQGRTTPGNIVTNARAGKSQHNFGLAVDVWPTGSATGFNWQAVGAEGKRLGLVWGGDWTIRDMGHFELPGGAAVTQAQAQPSASPVPTWARVPSDTRPPAETEDDGAGALLLALGLGFLFLLLS